MDLNSPDADGIFKLIVLAGFLGYLTERTVHAAAIKAAGGFHERSFIGHDLTIFLVTLLTSAAALLPPVAMYGFGDTVAFVVSSWHELGGLGFAIVAVVVIHLLAPLTVALLLLIGRFLRARRGLANDTVEPFFVALGMTITWVVGGCVAVLVIDPTTVAYENELLATISWASVGIVLIGWVGCTMLPSLRASLREVREQ